MFYRDACNNRPMQFGSKEISRKEFWHQCLTQWNTQTDAGHALRQHWKDQAKQANKQQNIVAVRRTQNQSLNQQLLHRNEEDSPSLIANLQFREGKGPLGIGDNSFALSIKAVEKADAEVPGFIKTYASKWSTRTSEQIEVGSEEGGTTMLSCMQHYGFCVQEIKNMNIYDVIFANLRNLVSDHRKRHLVKGKNKGPSVLIQQPLLFSRDLCLISNCIDTLFCDHEQSLMYTYKGFACFLSVIPISGY